MAEVKISLLREKGDTLDDLKLLGLPIVDGHILQEELIAFLASVIRKRDIKTGEWNGISKEGEVVTSITFRNVKP